MTIPMITRDSVLTELCVCLGFDFCSMDPVSREKAMPGLGDHYGHAEAFDVLGHYAEAFVSLIEQRYGTFINFFIDGWGQGSHGVFSYDVSSVMLDILLEKQWSPEVVDDDKARQVALETFEGLRLGEGTPDLQDTITDMLIT